MNRRQVFGLLAILLAASSAATFCLGSTYMERLSSFFVCCLSVFHAILAFWTTISRRTARSTDYIYFALTLLSILIAGFVQQHEREQQFSAFMSAMAPNPAEDILVSRLLMTGLKICPNPTIYKNFLGSIELEPETCELISHAPSILENKAYNQIPESFQMPAVGELIWHNVVHPIRILLNPMGFLSRYANSELRAALQFEMNTIYFARVGGASSSSQQVAADAIRSALRYFFSSFWPFILAAAIALRITRVTADVTEWPI